MRQNAQAVKTRQEHHQHIFLKEPQISAVAEYYILPQNMRIPSTKSWYIDCIIRKAT
jgi:hypothetical protein